MAGFSYVLLRFLRLLIEAVEDVEHGVLGSNVAPGFGAALGVDGAAYVAQVAQQVEGIKHHGEACLGEGARETGIPHQLVGVHGVVVVAAARVHGHVSGELEAEGYLEDTAEAVVEVGDVDGTEVLTPRGGVLPVEVALEVEAGLGGEAGVELECLVDVGSVYLAAQLLYEIDAVDVCGVGAGGVSKLAVFIEARRVVELARDVPVTVDIVGGDGAHTCLRVVGVAHGEAVPVDIGGDRSVELSLLLHVAIEIHIETMSTAGLEMWIAKFRS